MNAAGEYVLTAPGSIYVTDTQGRVGSSSTITMDANGAEMTRLSPGTITPNEFNIRVILTPGHLTTITFHNLNLSLKFRHQ